LTADPKLPERTYANGDTALHRAAAAGASRSAALLLEYGAKANARNKSGRTPLHLAALGKRKEAVAVLLDRGARPTIKDDDGQTPLFAAVFGKDVGVVTAMLAKRDAIDNDAYREALGVAVRGATRETSNAPVLRALLAKKGDLSLSNEPGARLLLEAVAMGHHDMVGELLEARAATDHDNLEFTPLHRAAQVGDLSLLGLLLARGARVNARDKGNERTPLHYAAEGGNVKVVQGLLAYRADPGAVDRRGATPLSLAGSAPVRELLQRAALPKQ
jgi:ankyrin repeat protein